ncbi:UNVERIFIED_CONTAM: Retrovirus-related Pol polyprotein from type-1 retrotransposable element R2 [Sesamum latifolium]|uniref:Retrovirus-related Pol polyprotein from type-1 retrotransposable element R2 n=1 Tax=Sesamum latifolium TaxID=2727402 RepID=A0AAW2Y0P5_9LAMI
MGTKITTFAGLFSSNRTLTDEKKLTKFLVPDGALTLEANDLVDFQPKLGYCLVGYIAGKFPRLKGISALAKTWGALFHRYDSGWLIFRFTREEDRQRVLAGGPYFVFGRPLMLKIMPACFEFKDDEISSTPIWATLPSLPLECWNPNALGKIGSKLGTPIAMDSLTMKMERLSYARVLVEVDASKKLVEEVEFILPNSVKRKQPVIYEYMPKFCSVCNRFGHLKDSCQSAHPPAATPTNTALAKPAAPPARNAQHSEWTVVQRQAQEQPATPTAGERSMWEKLIEVGQPLTLPWLILGDFNCVKSTAKKQLGVQPTWYELKDFNDCCLSLRLTDATTMGCYYTWYSNSDSNPVWFKLDRVLLNNEWLEVDLQCNAHFNPPGCLSDHSPDHSEFIATVEKGWRLNVEGTAQFKLCKKLKALKNSLKAFNRLHYSHISVRAKEADLALQNAQLHLESNPEEAAVRDSLGALWKKAVFLAEAERHFYYQKAKIHFLKMGDINTKFFHDIMKRNTAKSSILAITKSDGSTITSEADIGQEFVAYFTSLLGTEAQTLSVDSDVFEWGQSYLLNMLWSFVERSHTVEVTDFFRSERLLRQLNHCIIALVPKSDHSPTVADYRPISCCNVIYKAITKINADRVAPVLEHLIDRSQAAFVGERSITDNIFLAQEMVRQYTRKRISPRYTINVDLRKAFDSIMECVSTSSFSVALNGFLHGFFPGKRGLRQGDPMSPALFLLSIEYFSCLVKRRTSDSEFNFHPKCEKLKITYLLFADDLMLFSRGDLPSIHILMECLQEFQDVSSLAVNTSKSSIFTTGIQNDKLHGILARTDFDRGEMPVRYLGPSQHRGFRSPTIPHLWIKLPNLSQNGQLSHYRMRGGWNLFDRLFRVWSAFGSKFFHFQRRSLRKFTVFAGIFFGILGGHRSLGRKAVWASDTSRPGMWPFLPESYGTSTIKQTRCEYNGSTVSILEATQFGTGNRRRAIHHSFNGLPKFATG